MREQKTGQRVRARLLWCSFTDVRVHAPPRRVLSKLHLRVCDVAHVHEGVVDALRCACACVCVCVCVPPRSYLRLLYSSSFFFS